MVFKTLKYISWVKINNDNNNSKTQELQIVSTKNAWQCYKNNESVNKYAY